LIGSVGDAAAGLALLLDDRHATGPLVDIYRRPVPLLAAGQELAPHARAMMDVSDGLLLDAKRIAEASGCGVVIDLDAVPLTGAFEAARGTTLEARLFAVTGGDDYALLAALPPGLDPVLTLSLPSEPSLACVGTLAEAGSTLSLRSGGRPVPLPERLGYEHHGSIAAPVADRP
jgi:thiamine-monophosphate kinase